MKISFKHKLFVLVLGILIQGACNNTYKDSDKKVISVSILPQKFLVDRITGGKTGVNVLVPPGASPASYEATPRQVADMGNSLVYFRIGKIIFEKTWINNIVSQNPELKLVDLSEGISFLTTEKHEHHGDHSHIHGKEDPHIWMSPSNMLKISEGIYREILTLFPEDSLEFSRNYNHLIKDIQNTDSMFRADSQILTGMNFLIYHPALGYLAKDYGMNQHVLEVGGKEPGPGHMAEIITEAKKENIKFIFIQKQFDIENAKTLAAEIGAEIVEIDPLAENWIEEMKKIHTVLVSEGVK